MASITPQADVAVRGASTNGDLWIQAYVTADEPRDYDDPLKEDNTLGQLNSWVDNTVINYDGMMSAKAKAGKNHKDGVILHWTRAAACTT